MGYNFVDILAIRTYFTGIPLNHPVPAFMFYVGVVKLLSLRIVYPHLVTCLLQTEPELEFVIYGIPIRAKRIRYINCVACGQVAVSVRFLQPFTSVAAMQIINMN